MKKYVPTFRVESDDLTIADDEGNEHPLQPGGWVEFRTDYPYVWATADGTLNRAEYADLFVRILTRQLQAWNWTDARGRPYPQPGETDEEGEAFTAALLDLGAEERTWLLQHCWESDLPNE